MLCGVFARPADNSKSNRWDNTVDLQLLRLNTVRLSSSWNLRAAIRAIARHAYLLESFTHACCVPSLCAAPCAMRPVPSRHITPWRVELVPMIPPRAVDVMESFLD